MLYKICNHFRHLTTYYVHVTCFFLCCMVSTYHLNVFFFAWPLQVFWGEKTCIMCHPETHKNFGNERWGKKDLNKEPSWDRDMAVTGTASILLKIRWRYANMLIFHLHNLLKPFGFSPRTWHCIFALAADGSKRPQDEKPLALISCTWSMSPCHHDLRWSRVRRSLGHQPFEAKIFMLWFCFNLPITHYYHYIMLHLWNQRSPSNRCDLKLSAAYMLLQHVDQDIDGSYSFFELNFNA